MYSIIIGIVQGITEFLPISSSAHILLLLHIFPINVTNILSYQLALHLGTLAAVVIYYRRMLLEYFRKFRLDFFKDPHSQFSNKALWYILFASVPAGILGLFLDDIIESVFYNLTTIALTLGAGGILFLLAENYYKGKKDLTSITLPQALFMGFAQSLALIPGVSRSGITIIAGMSIKLNRESAANFSFLLAIPAISGASIIHAFKLFSQGISLSEIIIFGFGFVFSFISGFICIKYFMRYIKLHSLNIFAYYRLFLSILILLYLIF